jgi:photosystem II stability/assembly factor-like uncharacterized protein
LTLIAISIVLTLCAFAGHDLSADTGSAWSRVGPFGGNVISLAIDPVSPKTLYAGTSYGGIYRSANGGSKWSPASTGLTNTYVTTLAVDPVTPTTLYAGMNGGCVFKSKKGGVSAGEEER